MNNLLKQYIKSPSLLRHCEMVAQAMEAYANKLGEDAEKWRLTGLLHDIDWEMHPDEHPNKAISDILPQAGVDPEIIAAIAAHAPSRTGQKPSTPLEKYLFACDEICGFLDAVAKVRPEGFVGMKWSSVNKKLKNKSFAANVSRDDIEEGANLIETPLGDHTTFLINVFS
jgi:putative nucleotidyltransferase with HDIG domain